MTKGRPRACKVVENVVIKRYVGGVPITPEALHKMRITNPVIEATIEDANKKLAAMRKGQTALDSAS